MSEKYRFTVMLETFNSDWKKVRRTLDSILKQTFTNYEIVIADDGSEKSPEPQLRKYFEAKGFEHYTLVMNKENQGTVKNIISGLKAASGEYVRDFGVGDFFYDNTVLEKLDKFFSENNYDAVAGLMSGYSVSDKGTIRRNFYHPFDIEAYRKNKEDRILRNLAVYSDNFSGAAMCMTKDYYLEYMEKIESIVKYEEDIFQLLAALEGKRVHLWDDYMVWYEMGYGISTSGSSKFRELLAQDTDNFYNYVIKKFHDNKYIQKREKLQKYYKYRNVYVRTILRFFENPGLALYLASHYLQVARGCFKPHKTS